ncbi:MAG TPA: DUF2530 domain-containing protein [Mycobacteriales bacterium]|jgi:hypothetical protein|nr:DUF2530 domain-containing protein [Mycobacteriales bacterium]
MSRLQSLLRGSAPRQPDPEPLELDDTKVVAVGALGWAVALVVLLVADLFGARVPGWWSAMCLCGIALGLCGLRYIARRKARERAERRR